ncbi:MAG TPA: DUF2339 domain-containing protein [Verrucomicrobiae bacterium]|nr:DUF2339 domain-containing protein [Verrucomicrobiae bacterium]
MSDQQELQQLREEVRQLRQRLEEISRILDRLQSTAPPTILAATTSSRTAGDAPPPLETGGETVLPTSVEVAVGEVPPTFVPPPVVPPQESFEVRLGTYWLPRIGIAVFLTGMVFFAAWVTPRLTAPHKVALGYLTCFLIGVLGIWLDKKTPQFARILQAGALALAYFVTYAAYFVDAFRIIHNLGLALGMLSVVVLFIVAVAQEQQSPTLGGMALFFGYYTSVVSGVATFTLASNAVLALAAIFFLMRNRWVHISYGAVLATYLTYMIWVWKLTNWGDLDHLIFDSGYLAAPDFRLRAAFLSLYWLVFMVGGLIANREAMSAPERNGLLTLNNVFFFLLFSLLMHHAYPDKQWAFQFCFGGALLILSALAYQPLAPERSVMDALFLQGVAVATLGLISYFKGVRLVAVLSLESAFLLVLARWMQLRWVAWIGRAAFAVAAVYAWSRYEDWDAALRYGVWFATAAGFVCARLENRTPGVVAAGFSLREDSTNAPVKGVATLNLSAFYFAILATGLAMTAARQEFSTNALPWVWILGAVLVAVVGGALRTREILWASHLPLAWAYGEYYAARVDDRAWALAPSLALIAVTFAFGLVMWGRARADDDPARASTAFLPYAVFAILVAIIATLDFVPKPWRLTAFAAETLILIIAAALANERVFAWSSLATLIVGVLGYLAMRRRVFLDNETAAWWNFIIAFLLFLVSERICKRRATVPKQSVWLVAALTLVALFALQRLAGSAYLTVSWAVLGFVLLAFGFAVKERSYRMAGLVTLGFSLLRAVLHDLANVETIYRILSFIGLGVILLVLAFLYAKNREKLAKWL